MTLLPPETIHPAIIQDYERLVEIGHKKEGMLGEFPWMASFLLEQVEAFKYSETIFAHDFAPDAGARLMNYFIGEVRELVQEIPILTEGAGPVDGIASYEAGDVVWFAAMRVGLSQLDPEVHGLTIEDAKTISGVMGILYSLQQIYDQFDPIKHIQGVREKVERNYPSRALRADPNWSLGTMALDFEHRRYPVLRALRKTLPGGMIDKVVYKAIAHGVPTLPVLADTLPGYLESYQAAVYLALEASNFYAY